MAVKAGQILHDAHGFVIDRIQTGGVSNLNIPEEKIYELGNFQTVATIRDIPDLSFDLESLDVSTEIESLVLFRDPTAAVDGNEYDFNRSVPMDIISPFKAGQGLYNIVRGIVVPHLTLESVTYRMGITANATQAFTLRGDAVYYTPGTPYYEQFVHDGTTATYAFANAAIPYSEAGDLIHALAITAIRPDGTSQRLFFGDAYTDTAADFTLLTPAAVPAGSTLRVVYASAVAATYPQTVHQGVTVKPAAVRGKDIDVYMDFGAGLTRWTGIQSFETTRRVNLDNDQEFGNHHFVSSDYDTADVDGNFVVRPRDAVDLFTKLQTVANVPADQVAGVLTSIGRPMEIRISDPETGARLKTLYIPDARVAVPNVQGRVQTKLEVTFNFTSDGGNLFVYKGARP